MAEIEKSVQISAPIGRVWEALTDYKQFGAWFEVHIEGPFVVGEVSTGHITYPGYEHVKWESTIVKMEPETYFSYTWHPFAVEKDVDYSEEEPTLVEFRLESNAEGTLLTVTESGFDKVPAHRREEAIRMDDGGWAAQMKSIKEYVEGNP